MPVTKFVPKYVAYYRESTKKQVSRRQAEKFGLQSQAGVDEERWGLDSQKLEVQQYIAANGGTLIAEYIEAESGRKSNRPKLKEALKHVKLSGAVLIVAKLERLARNVAFLSALMESKVEFICCDLPGATPLTLHLLAAVAEDEVRRTSTRTKSGLTAAKAAGVKLGAARPGYWERGDRTLLLSGARAAVIARKKTTKEFRDLIGPFVVDLKARGLTLKQMAAEMNKRGFQTQVGKSWTETGVCKLLRHLEGRPAAEGKSANLALKLAPDIVAELKTRYEGGEQCTALAQWLNSKGLRTTRGNEWDAVSVYRKVNYGKKPTKR